MTQAHSPNIEEPLDYQRMQTAIEFLITQQFSQPSLGQLANHLQLSEFHVQRLFSHWVGLSPKQFLQYLNKQHAKQLLSQHSVYETALATGLSSASRVYDLLVQYESITPGEYKTLGKGLQIYYALHTCQFGHCLLAITQRGLCKLAFYDSPEQAYALIEELKAEWPNAQIDENSSQTETVFKQIFSTLAGNNLIETTIKKPLKVLMKGSAFQLQVWQALLEIPWGDVCSYQQLADNLGKPSAVRAVASAIARNHIGFIIPCHRVIRSNGELSHYRWGDARKAQLLAWEGRHTMTTHNS